MWSQVRDALAALWGVVVSVIGVFANATVFIPALIILAIAGVVFRSRNTILRFIALFFGAGAFEATVKSIHAVAATAAFILTCAFAVFWLIDILRMKGKTFSRILATILIVIVGISGVGAILSYVPNVSLGHEFQRAVAHSTDFVKRL